MRNEEEKGGESQDEEEESEDEKTAEENIQNYFDLDEEMELKRSYQSMIDDMNNQLQIKSQKDYRVNYVLKKLVSRQKRRYIQDGFDLDLTYVTKNIIAMGFPSRSLERMYRNSMSEVQRFLKTRHAGHYKVYNLCSESSRRYPPECFEKVSTEFTFPDHNPPPFELMVRFCKDLHAYLTEDEKNVAAVHCKAGKGRTGVMICAYLLYSKLFEKASNCLVYYGMSRTLNSKGITIPSQIRYIYYFEYLLKGGLEVVPSKKGKIIKIRIFTIPRISLTGGCEPHFHITSGPTDYFTIQDVKPPSLKSSTTSNFYELKLPKPVEVVDDVCVDCYNKGVMGKGDKIFSFWFHVSFVKENGILVINKNMIDKAFHDKANKKFDKNFRVELEIAFDAPEGSDTLSLESPLVKRLLKLVEVLPLPYRKLPLIQFIISIYFFEQVNKLIAKIGNEE